MQKDYNVFQELDSAREGTVRSDIPGTEAFLSNWLSAHQ